jgi:hypothetical protein
MAIKAAYAKLEHLKHQASGFPSLLPHILFPSIWLITSS